MRNHLVLLLVLAALLAASGCADPDPDRERVLAMIETLRPEMEEAIGDSLGVIEVTRVLKSQMQARVLATARAASTDSLSRREFEERWQLGESITLFEGLNHPAADTGGNLYFCSLPTSREALARNTEEALLRSYQVRTLEMHPFLRNASGDEERRLRWCFVLRHSKYVSDRLIKLRGAGRPLIFPGSGSSKPRSLVSRTTRLTAAKMTVWDSRLVGFMEDRYPALPAPEAFKRVFSEPPRSSEEVTGLSTTSGPGFDLAGRASESLWPRLTSTVPVRMLPEVIGAQFLTAGPEASRRAAGLVKGAFDLSAKSAQGFVRISVFGTADQSSARELLTLWVEEEQSLDEACRPGTESGTLLSAEYEEVTVAGCMGILIRRLEEDRVFLGTGLPEPAWPRPQRLILVCGADLLVVDLHYALAFPADAPAIARLILDESEADPWPDPPEGDNEDALIAGLASADPQVRWWSLDGIAAMISEDDPGWEMLAPTLREKQPFVLARSLAAIGNWLEHVHYPMDDIQSLIVRFCAHPDPEVRANAFRCLLNLSSSESGAEAAIEAGLDDSVASVRCYAFWTWSRSWTETTPPPAAAVPTLIRMAEDKSSVLSRDAAKHLSHLGGSAAETVPLLTAALTSEHPTLRAGAARALRGIGSNSPEVLKALRRLFDTDPSEEVTEEAWWALTLLTGNSFPWTERFE